MAIVKLPSACLAHYLFKVLTHHASLEWTPLPFCSYVFRRTRGGRGSVCVYRLAQPFLPFEKARGRQVLGRRGVKPGWGERFISEKETPNRKDFVLHPSPQNSRHTCRCASCEQEGFLRKAWQSFPNTSHQYLTVDI